MMKQWNRTMLHYVHTHTVTELVRTITFAFQFQISSNSR